MPPTWVQASLNVTTWSAALLPADGQSDIYGRAMYDLDSNFLVI